MSNFSGVAKNGRTFRPKGPGAPDTVIARPVGGAYEAITDYEVKKADQPVLDTTPTPRTDGRGEGEIGLSGLVDHPDADGGAKYLAGKIARVYRQLVADGADLESLSVEQRRSMRDQLIQGVYDGDGQHPSGEAGSKGQADVLAYITAVANVLFGLADEIPNTPTFLTRSAATGTLLKSLGQDVTVYCRILHKDASKREVHGVIAEEAPDNSGEIFDYASSEPHFKKWSSDQAERTLSAGLPVSYGNVRAQHSHEAVGKLTSIQFDAKNKRIPVVAKIVDDAAWTKVQNGIYTGFSIGGKYLNKWQDGRFTRYTAFPAEVSLVDNPCMPGATFSMVKDAVSSNPEVAALKKQLADLTEKIRGILARRAGVDPMEGRRSDQDRGSRFVAKGNDPRELMKQALSNGTPVPFSGADPRDAAAKSGGERFQTRG